MQLTERQQRERAFYSQHVKQLADEAIVFDPILGVEQRPWNPYWFVYQTAMNHFRDSSNSLLDFGCGAGSAAMLYAKIGYLVSGFDICEDHIRLCNLKAQKYGFESQTNFSVQAAEGLDYANESFDLVAGIDILHHVEIPLAIQEVYRVLKPGGIAVFREYVEVPVFDTWRNTPFAIWLFPRGGCGHHTDDERKLNKQDLKVIRAQFANLTIHRFGLFARIYQVVPRRHPERPCRMEQIDRRIFQWIPLARPFGGEIVMVMKK